MKIISKRNFMLMMAIFLLFVTVASVSATDISVTEGDIAVDTLSSSDDTILYSANPEDELSAVTDESSDVLQVHDTSDLEPMYNASADYSENHVYTVQPTLIGAEFLSHFREVSAGVHDPRKDANVYWTAVENGTMYLIVDMGGNTHFSLHNPHNLVNLPNTYQIIEHIPTPHGGEYTGIAVIKFTNVRATSLEASIRLMRNQGEPIDVTGIQIMNSTNITLFVNDKFEDTIYLGESADLSAFVTLLNYIDSKVTSGTVHYNVTDVNGTAIINPIGTSVPGDSPDFVPLVFTPNAIGDYIFKAWFEDHLGDENFESHSNTVILHVIAPPTVDLSVEKTVNNATPYVGEEVTFTITVTNNGPDDATEVTVTDKLPDGLVYVSDDSNGNYNPDTGVWNIENLANQSKATLNIVALVNTTFANNTAKVSVKESDTNSSNDEDFAIVEATYSVILNITKTANTSEILVGDQVEFTITVENIGKSNATQVNITDELNAAFEYVSSTPTATVDGQKIIWTIGTLAPNNPQTFKVIVTVNKEGTFNNTATVISKENETETNDTTNITANTVILKITKTPNATDVYVGDLVKFTITVENIGTGNATNAMIRDAIDIDIFKYYNSDADEVQEDLVIWNVNLAPGESFTGQLILMVLTEGTHNNTAAVNCDENETEVNDSAEITASKLHVTIVVGNYTTTPGKTVTVEITVTDENGNNVTCELNVIVTGPESTDTLPPHEGILVAVASDKLGADAIPVSINNGKGSFNYTVPDDAVQDTSYILTATLSDNPKYYDAEGTGYIDVIQYKTSITVSNATKYPGDEVEVTFTVNTEDNVPFNGDINVTLPDGSTTLVTITEGTGKYTWTVPEDAQKGDEFVFEASFDGNGTYLPSSGTGTVKVIKLKTTTTVSNATGKPGETVTLTVKVTTEDGTPFNGDVVVTLPNGKNITVTIKNGVGTFDWTIPKDATKDSVYEFIAYCNGDLIYMESSGTGFVDVVTDGNNTPGNTTPTNGTTNPPVKTMLNTGNPIVVLVAAMIFLGLGLKRREDE